MRPFPTLLSSRHIVTVGWYFVLGFVFFLVGWFFFLSFLVLIKACLQIREYTVQVCNLSLSTRPAKYSLSFYNIQNTFFIYLSECWVSRVWKVNSSTVLGKQQEDDSKVGASDVRFIASVPVFSVVTSLFVWPVFSKGTGSHVKLYSHLP